MFGADTTRVVLARDQQAFVHDASHALRDPLTICRGHLELFGDDPDEQRRTVALVMAELDRMGRMIDDLELLAEASEPDFLQPDWIEVALFTHELVAKADALAPRRWTLDHAAEGTVLADERALIVAVMNLAENAVNHTRSGETIGIGTMLNESELRMWVRDTGCGISVSEQPRIFERFTRGANAHRHHRGGGLGLPVVKAIAEAHHGRVEFESGRGKGSTFTIVLPRAVLT
jgi:two-component system OmpR family sensor kinase